MKNLLLILLYLAMIIDMFFIANQQHDYRIFTKPLLLPILILLYHVVSKSRSNLFIYGLVFSFLGDVFLLFNWGFIPGLASFFVAHIFYILTFRKRIKQHIYSFIPVLALYLTGLIVFLFPYLNEMKIPVILYGIVITTMLYCAVCSQNQWLIIGALLFVCSDTLLSFNVFCDKYIWREILVMLTYVVAQTCLVFGIKRNKKRRTKRIKQL